MDSHDPSEEGDDDDEGMVAESEDESQFIDGGCLIFSRPYMSNRQADVNNYRSSANGCCRRSLENCDAFALITFLPINNNSQVRNFKFSELSKNAFKFLIAKHGQAGGLN